jgi:hypothetical protein
MSRLGHDVRAGGSSSRRFKSKHLRRVRSNGSQLLGAVAEGDGGVGRVGDCERIRRGVVVRKVLKGRCVRARVVADGIGQGRSVDRSRCGRLLMLEITRDGLKWTDGRRSLMIGGLMHRFRRGLGKGAR